MNPSKFFVTALAICISTLSFGQKVGSDADANGCIGSKDYTYSSIKKECIRIFEQKILFEKHTDNSEITTNLTCVIFSVNNKKAEFFLDGTSIILNRKGKKGAYTWANSKYVLGEDNGEYFIRKGDEVIYRQLLPNVW